MKKENKKTVPTKRMSLKKIVAILGIALTAVLTFVGCGEFKTNKDPAYSTTDRISHKNAYIVVEEKDGAILHRGDVSTEGALVNGGGYGSAVPILKLDCGEALATYNFTAHLNKKPDETKYDHVCHDCFPDAEVGE